MREILNQTQPTKKEDSMSNKRNNHIKNSWMKVVPETLDDVSKDHVSALRGLGIEEPRVYFKDTVARILINELTKDFWEVQPSPLGERFPMIMPVKIAERKVVYTGSKRDKLKSLSVMMDIPPISYSIHSLKQYRSRTRGKSIILDNLHGIDKEWVKAAKVLDESLETLKDGDAIEMSTLNNTIGNMMMPYGNGAFIGDMARFSNGLCALGMKHYKGKAQADSIQPELKPHFIAISYITFAQMYPNQRYTLECIEAKEYQKAIDNIKATHIQKEKIR